MEDQQHTPLSPPASPQPPGSPNGEGAGSGIEPGLRARLSAARSGSFSRLLPPSPHLTPRSEEGKGSPLRLDYGIWSIQGRRKTQEDAHSAVPKLLEGEEEEEAQRPFAFFGVYDGHGGEKASEWVGQHFDKIFGDKITQSGNQTSAEVLSKALREAFLEVEDQWMGIADQKKECSGTTAAVVVVKDNDIIVGNVGDTEVVVAASDEAEQLQAIAVTEVHNPKKNKAEGERVVKEGGIIHRDRVGHPQFNPDLMSIAISRAIGDYGFKAKEFTGGKNSGLIAEPYVTTLTLQPNKHKFCIIACDGLWDVITADEAVAFIAKEQAKEDSDAEDAAKALVEAAYKKGSTDNITVLVIYFHWDRQQQQ